MEGTTLESDSAVAERLGYGRRRTTAVVLGAVVPGSGHLYAGEWLKSYPIFLSTAGSLAVGTIIFSFDRCTFSLDVECESRVPVGARIAGAVMIAGAAALWVESARDAGRAVARQRARRAARARAAVAPIIVPGSARGASRLFGLAVQP